jgi:putative spermidine/putrescine transport system ATP-binding protein
VTNSTGHALDLQRVTHRFGATVAANNVDLDIRPGELISLLGPSGCGKTTLLKIIAGFLRQTSGDVLVDGASITHLPANRRQIGIVFQNYALFPHMTVGENIAYGPAAAGRPKSEIAGIVGEMLDVVQMGAFRERLPRELSGGQQQRVALARCLAIRPRILLLDEPFSALDKNLRLDIQIEIKRLQHQSGITTVLVTHDQEEALSMSDRIAVLSRGDLEQFASPTDIYDRPASIFVNTFVGTANLIKGVLVGKTASGSAVRLGRGDVVETNLSTPLLEGAAVLLSVRPEGVRLSATRDAGALPARITAVMPIGPSLIYEVALEDGTPIKVVQERQDSLGADALSQEIFLFLKPNRASGLFADPSRTIQKE